MWFLQSMSKCMIEFEYVKESYRDNIFCSEISFKFNTRILLNIYNLFLCMYKTSREKSRILKIFKAIEALNYLSKKGFKINNQDKNDIGQVMHNILSKKLFKYNFTVDNIKINIETQIENLLCILQ